MDISDGRRNTINQEQLAARREEEGTFRKFAGTIRHERTDDVEKNCSGASLFRRALFPFRLPPLSIILRRDSTTALQRFAADLRATLRSKLPHLRI